MSEFLLSKDTYKRILSSIVLIAIALLSIYYKGYLLISSISIIILIMSYEWMNITENIDTFLLKITKSFMNLIVFLLSLITIKFSLYFYLIIIIINFMGKKTYKKNNLFVLLGPVYICLPFILLYKIRFLSDGLYLLSAFLILVWTTDSFSYFCGKYIGGRKLSKSISPNKTWSGFICGIIAATLITIILFKFYNYNFYISLIFGFILSVFVQLGDLLESWIKRKHMIKDSGKLIPGHGGFLDRLDGLLLSSIMLYIGCLIYYV